MAKQLTLGFVGGLISDLARYPCADVIASVPYFPQRDSDSYKPVQDEVIEVPKPSLVVPKVPGNWDLRKKDLINFSRSTLEDVFYGIHNLWVPTQMLDLENPDEIIANYLAAGVLKRYNGHKVNDNIPKGSFSELIKYMNRVAYSNPVFAANSHNFKRRFSANPGEQVERLAGLSGEVKRQFCRSFYRSYIASDKEEPKNYEAFYDPSFRHGYMDRIYQHFKGRFEREHTKK